MGIELAQESQELLTPEELAAINDEPSDAEKAILAAVAAGAAGDEEDEDDDGATAASAAATAAAPADAAPAATAAAPATSPAASPASAPAAAEAAPAPAPTAAETSTAAPATAMEHAPAPVYVAKLPDDFDARSTAVKEREAKAWAEFNTASRDGGDPAEIQAKLQAELRAVSEEREALNRIQTKAEVATEITAQTAEAQWQRAIDTFMDGAKQPEAGGVDYRTDQKRAADLDIFVRALGNDPANADKAMGWFLQEAHKRVLALHGLTPAPRSTPPAPPAAPAQAPDAGAPAAPAAPAASAAAAARKPDVSDLPASLAHVPGSDGPGDVGGEFAHLDRLEGFALEDAIKAMTPAQRERYSRGQ